MFITWSNNGQNSFGVQWTDILFYAEFFQLLFFSAVAGGSGNGNGNGTSSGTASTEDDLETRDLAEVKSDDNESTSHVVGHVMPPLIPTSAVGPHPQHASDSTHW